jgi:hypothetical protein
MSSTGNAGKPGAVAVSAAFLAVWADCVAKIGGGSG